MSCGVAGYNKGRSGRILDREFFEANDFPILLSMTGLSFRFEIAPKSMLQFITIAMFGLLWCNIYGAICALNGSKRPVIRVD